MSTLVLPAKNDLKAFLWSSKRAKITFIAKSQQAFSNHSYYRNYNHNYQHNDNPSRNHSHVSYHIVMTITTTIIIIITIVVIIIMHNRNYNHISNHNRNCNHNESKIIYLNTVRCGRVTTTTTKAILTKWIFIPDEIVCVARRSSLSIREKWTAKLRKRVATDQILEQQSKPWKHFM